jgi:subtilisin family serine protease
MSLGGGLSTALNAAVAAVVAGGVSFAVAAGNENTDACTKSPASTATAISVGATTVEGDFSNQDDFRSSFSNYGNCVRICPIYHQLLITLQVTLFAPGSLVTSAWIGSNTATNRISGTSMASPHMAGAIALYLVS